MDPNEALVCFFCAAGVLFASMRALKLERLHIVRRVAAASRLRLLLVSAMVADSFTMISFSLSKSERT